MEIITAKRKLEELENEYFEQRKKYRKLVIEHQRRIKEDNDIIADLAEKDVIIDDLNKELNQRDIDNAIANTNIKILEDLVAKLNLEIIELNRKNNELEQKINALEGKNNKLEQKINALEETNVNQRLDYSQQFATMNKNFEFMNKRIDDLTAEKEKYKSFMLLESILEFVEGYIYEKFYFEDSSLRFRGMLKKMCDTTGSKLLNKLTLKYNKIMGNSKDKMMTSEEIIKIFEDLTNIRNDLAHPLKSKKLTEKDVKFHIKNLKLINSELLSNFYSDCLEMKEGEDKDEKMKQLTNVKSMLAGISMVEIILNYED